LTNPLEPWTPPMAGDDLNEVELERWTKCGQYSINRTYLYLDAMAEAIADYPVLEALSERMGLGPSAGSWNRAWLRGS